MDIAVIKGICLINPRRRMGVALGEIEFVW